MEASVSGLFIAASESAPTEERDQVIAVAGRGIEGDRYFQPDDESAREPSEEITLFESEGLEVGRAAGVDIEPADMRRNVMTSGVTLRDLIGKRFFVGEVLVEALADNPPCNHLQSLAGKPLLKPMIEQGGVRGRILRGGTITTGDPITPADPD